MTAFIHIPVGILATSALRDERPDDIDADGKLSVLGLAVVEDPVWALTGTAEADATLVAITHVPSGMRLVRMEMLADGIESLSRERHRLLTRLLRHLEFHYPERDLHKVAKHAALAGFYSDMLSIDEDENLNPRARQIAYWKRIRALLTKAANEAATAGMPPAKEKP